MIFLLDSIELWLSSNRNILQFFSFLSNSLIKPNLLQEPCFHNSHKTLKFVYGLWLLMRSFFLNLFLIFQLHSLMFRIVQLIINQALYRACTGIVSYHLSLKWLLCFQTALFHKIFFELVRGRKMYFSLHLELWLFSWKYKKDFFALEKLQGMNIYISKWGYYSKTKKSLHGSIYSSIISFYSLVSSDEHWTWLKSAYIETEILNTQKKLHACEEGGAYFRIFVWHLLMNLKNSYLLKKLLKLADKKCKIFHIYNVALFLNQ